MEDNILRALTELDPEKHLPNAFYKLEAICVNCGERGTYYFLKGHTTDDHACPNCEVSGNAQTQGVLFKAKNSKLTEGENKGGANASS